MKPLEDGDSGTPLTAPEADGDLESRSDARRRWGVAVVYRPRVAIGDAGCGRAGDRDDAIPGEALRELNRGLISVTENKEEAGEK